MNQSGPGRLWREGAGLASPAARGATNDTTLPPPAAPPGRLSSIRSGELDGRATRMFLRYLLMVKIERRQAAGRAQHHDRLVFLVFGRGVDLLLGQFKRDAVALVGNAAEMQC